MSISRRFPAGVLAALALAAAGLAGLAGCGSQELKPVDIYPEDNCSNCRMAISDQSVAGEIITSGTEVFKFDDLGCLEQFRARLPRPQEIAVFVKDFNSKAWIRYEESVIVMTGIRTPMGSGKIAFRDSSTAISFAAGHPPATSSRSGAACCQKEND